MGREYPCATSKEETGVGPYRSFVDAESLLCLKRDRRLWIQYSKPDACKIQYNTTLASTPRRSFSGGGGDMLEEDTNPLAQTEYPMVFEGPITL